MAPTTRKSRPPVPVHAYDVTAAPLLEPNNVAENDLETSTAVTSFESVSDPAQASDIVQVSSSKGKTPIVYANHCERPQDPLPTLGQPEKQTTPIPCTEADETWQDSSDEAQAAGAQAKANIKALHDEKRQSLGEAIQETHRRGLIQRALSGVPPAPTTSSSIDPFLVPNNNSTGFPMIDRAIDDLQNGIRGLWIGNPRVIEDNCNWVQEGTRQDYTLRYKEDAVVQPEGFEPNGLAIVGFIGRVSADSVLTPDAGYNTAFQSATIHKRKWTVLLTRPSPETRVPSAFYSSQTAGAAALVESGRRALDGKELFDVGHSFFDSGVGVLRVRSPVFEPLPTPVPGSDDEEENVVSPEREAGVPPAHRFRTWNFSSPAIRTAFREVIERGFDPQVLEAYNTRDKLIHVNHTQPVLVNAVVVVWCTLEKALFRGNAQPNGRAWQFYANLVKVQVIQQAPTGSFVSKKRISVQGYTEKEGRHNKQRKIA